jgi:hypothetical protein
MNIVAAADRRSNDSITEEAKTQKAESSNSDRPDIQDACFVNDLPIKEHFHKGNAANLLPRIEGLVKSNDPNNVGAPLRIGFLIAQIVDSPELLEKAGCQSKKEYIHAAPVRLDMEVSTVYDYLQKTGVYVWRLEELKRHGLDLESNPDFFLKGGHVSKLPLLDSALKRCSPKRRGASVLPKLNIETLDQVTLMEKELEVLSADRYTEDEIFEHFCKDSFRDFRYFVRPELIREDAWRRQWKDWKEEILKTRKTYPFLLIFPFDPSSEDSFELKNRVIDADKEAHRD